MWPRTLYFALLFPAFHGLSIADELNAFTPPTLDHPLKVKVVVVAMFEVGADTGDVPGEFQFWVERRKLDHVISLPAAYHDVRTDGNGLIGTRKLAIMRLIFRAWKRLLPLATGLPLNYSISGRLTRFKFPAQLRLPHQARNPTDCYDSL